MENIALFFTILLAVRSKGAPTDVTTLTSRAEATVNALSSKGNVDDRSYALQMRMNGSTIKAKTLIGSNLNVGPASDNTDEVNLKHFLREISTDKPFKNKDDEYKKLDNLKGAPIKSLSPLFIENTIYDLNNEYNKVDEAVPLVIDHCIKRIDGKKRHIQNLQKKQHVLDNDLSKPRIYQGTSSYEIRDLTMEPTTSSVNTKIHDSTQNYDFITKNDRKRRTNIKVSNLITPSYKRKDLLSNKQKEDNYNNSTLHFSVTENIFKAVYTEEAWFETKDKTKIRFSKLPQRESYLIPTLKLEDGYYPFRFMSQFFTLIYPFDFPVELVKDIVWGKFNFPYSFIKSIKVESTFLAFIIIFACIALIVPAYLICLAFLAILGREEVTDNPDTGALCPTESTNCNGRIGVAVMLFLVLISVVAIGGMTVSSEQAAGVVSISHEALHCVCTDIAKWLSSAARELLHSVTSPLDLVLETYKKDLRNVDSLLGEPVRKTIASESGIDLVLDSLGDIILGENDGILTRLITEMEESDDISSKIVSLRDVTFRAGSLAMKTADRMIDLTRQLDNVKRHCIGKDIQLCDTIKTNSLELLMKFDLINREKKLLELRTIGVDNLTRAATASKNEFAALPSVISKQTAAVREDILKHVEARKEVIQESSRVLNDIVRHLTVTLQTAARRVAAVLARLETYEFWRWVIMTGCVTACISVIILIWAGLLIGCGSAQHCAKVSLQMSTVWMSVTSIILWTLLSATFLIAGHAEVYVCNALWDHPQYQTLTALLDKPSPLLPDDEGIFDALFREMDNITINISIRDVIRDCEHDQPAYNVFKLDRFLDVNKETSYFEWDMLQKDITTLSTVVDVGILKSMSDELSTVLFYMLNITDVNLAEYRVEYNGALVGRDLPSLVAQLETIAAQVTDLTTSGRFETLASRTQRLYVTSIKPLEQMRADIVYKLTELELQLSPFRRNLNISLSHIHTSQYYIDNQGDVIAQKKVTLFTRRLISHIAEWRKHVLTAAGTQAAKCKPLFDVFSAARTLLCTQFIGSLHGWWVCAFLLGCLWCFAAPLSASIWRKYGRKHYDGAITLSNMGSGQQSSHTPTTMCDTSNWNIPGPPPMQNESW